MRIGVDARNLVHNVTGISRYLLETCRMLSSFGHEIIYYFPEKPKSCPPELQSTIVRVANCSGGLRRMFWGQTILPHLARCDEIDVFWGPAHRLPSLLDRRIPRVVTIHDLVWHHARSTMRLQGWLGDRYLMSPAIHTADRIVVVSQATADSVHSMFPGAARKLRVIYPGLTSVQSVGSDAFLEENGIAGPFALFIGTLEPRKNLMRLLEAYARLPTTTKQKLLLVIAGGKGWHMGDIRSNIQRLGINDYIRLTGYVSDLNLWLLYRNARLLVMPSIYEGFGLPIIEANAMGVPAITSNCSSMPEVAGGSALLVDPFDVAEISAALQALAVDDNLHLQLSQNARVNAKRFNWSESTRALVAVLEEAIAERQHLGREY
jgi:glycosyltransferase involved in cell wall biosynthesis